MTIDMLSTALLRAARSAVRPLVVLLGLGAGSLVAPALATPPESWEDTDNGSALELLLILGGIPLAITLVLTLLVYLPSMMRGQSSEPALAFQERSEWFGGPRKGIEGTSGTAGEGEDKGGAGGRW